MITRTVFACLSIFMLMSLPAVSSGSSEPVWPDFPTPAGADVGWVGRDIVYNGVPMQIRHMKSALSPEDIIDFYRHQWQKTDKDKLLIEKKSPWVLLHKITSTVFYTVEVHPIQGGSESILTLSKLPEIQQKYRHDSAGLRAMIASQGAGFPKLHGSIMQMDMSSYDEGVQARTILYRNTYDVENNVLYVSSELINSGWSKAGDYKTNRGDMGRQLVFKRANEQIVMTVRQSGGFTEVTANQTRQL